MSLSRRTGARFQASIWPGFVDAMTGLLLVLMFVLTIFMVVQFVLQETIKGQGSALQELNQNIQQKDEELRDLSDQIAALGDALGLERVTAEGLREEVAGLSANLAASRDEGLRQSALLLAMTVERDEKQAELDAATTQITSFEAQVADLLLQKANAEGQIADFETQVAGLISQNSQAAGEITDFEAQVAQLLAAQTQNQTTIAELQGEQATLEQSLEAARATITAQIAAANLAQSQQEALDAMIADLRAQAEDTQTSLVGTLALLADEKTRAEELAGQNAELQSQAEDLTVTLNTTAIEAAAAEILRERLAETQAALSAEETERLAQAAAAEKLRKDLEGSQAALTAMTLNLDAERRRAEETLALLEAAKSTGNELTEKLSTALLALEAAEAAKQLTAEELATAKANGEVSQEKLQEALIKLTNREAELTQLQASLLDVETDLQGSVTDAERLAADLVASENARVAAQTALIAAQSNLEARNAEVTRLQAALAQQQGTSANQSEELTKLRQDLITAQAERDAARATLANADQDLLASQAVVQQLGEDLKAAQSLADGVDDLRNQLASAIARKLAAEQSATDQLSKAEEQSVLLAAAQIALDEQKEISTEAQRQVSVLSEQVSELRAQLGGLQATLGDFERRDEASQVEIAALGGKLNTALGQVASEERKNRLLQEAENKRLLEEAERLAAEAQSLERYKSEFLEQLRDILEGRDGVSIVGDRFVFSSEVLFPPGGADLSDAGKDEIAKIANLLKEIAAQMPDGIDWVLQVDGHTDDQQMSGNGSFDNNWELSQARALSVVLYMINDLDLPPNRLSANGFGEYQPLNPEDSVFARSQNRRIELKFTEK